MGISLHTGPGANTAARQAAPDLQPPPQDVGAHASPVAETPEGPARLDPAPSGFDEARPVLGQPRVRARTAEAEPSPAERNEQSALSLFARYSAGDPAGIKALLSTNTTYEDPLFPHLDGEKVGKMWDMVASSGKVYADVGSVNADRDSAKVSWVAKYEFLGASIENHIETELKFDEQGKVTSQKDTFDWKAWGEQTPWYTSWLLKRPVGQKLLQFVMGRRLDG